MPGANCPTTHTYRHNSPPIFGSARVPTPILKLQMYGFHRSYKADIYHYTGKLWGTLIWTPEMRPPLYSGHFEMSQSIICFLVQIHP